MLIWNSSPNSKRGGRKECKRRARSMGIVASENACYTLLAFICLKMELHWKLICLSFRNWPIKILHKKVDGTLGELKCLTKVAIVQYSDKVEKANGEHLG